jgi:predicted ATP-dependent endonuclease of OLD family
MKLKLKNIGTLKQAEIDLSKDLIILAGPNNTGKTYAAYTVYGVCTTLRKDGSDFINRRHISNLMRNYESKGDNESINIELSDFLNSLILDMNEMLKDILIKQLGNTFATNSSNFIATELHIDFDLSHLKNYLISQSIEPSLTAKYFEITKEKDSSKINLKAKKELGKIGRISMLLPLLFGDIDFFTHIIVDFYFKNIYINTAERSAINIFSKELSIKRNNIVDQLLELRDSRNGNTDQLLSKLQRYPLPIRDSLTIAEDLANLSRNKSEFGFLADRIEEVLLDGKITTSKDGEVQYSPNKSKVKNLSIHLTASIVKSLSNLVFYFRHLAQKGDFIIIDEPELNLHPDNQRKVARLFGEIINQGFKVMISTHSDYIIRELNNLIMLKSGGEKAEYLANKYGYEEKQLIDYQRVGAYLFNHNKNESLEVTKTGFEVNTIDEVINELNNASEEIYFTLFD